MEWTLKLVLFQAEGLRGKELVWKLGSYRKQNIRPNFQMNTSFNYPTI